MQADAGSCTRKAADFTAAIIDLQGKAAYIWRKVSVNGHAETVAKKLGEIAGELTN